MLQLNSGGLEDESANQEEEGEYSSNFYLILLLISVLVMSPGVGHYVRVCDD